MVINGESVILLESIIKYLRSIVDAKIDKDPPTNIFVPSNLANKNKIKDSPIKINISNVIKILYHHFVSLF
jgi:hypothetical protein